MKHNFDLSIKTLKAGAGDAILIRYQGTDNKDYNLLIDGGAAMAYPRNLRIEIEELAKRNETLDLIVVTHHDNDHAKGIEKLLQDINGKRFGHDLAKTMWINALIDSTEVSTKMGAATAKNITDQIKGAKNREAGFKILAGDEFNFGGALIHVISPTTEIRSQWEIYFENELEKLNNNRKTAKGVVYCDHAEDLKALMAAKDEQDSSIANGVSIAFILKIGDFVGLFLGDAWANQITDQLRRKGFSAEKPLEVDLFKLSHHGGFKNISTELLDLVKAKNYVVSSNGKKCKPSKRTFAKIVNSRHYSDDVQFIFNYPTNNYEGIFSADEASELNLLFANYERGFQWPN